MGSPSHRAIVEALADHGRPKASLSDLPERRDPAPKPAARLGPRLPGLY